MGMDDDGWGCVAVSKWTVLQLVSYWMTIWAAYHIGLPDWINEHAKRGVVVTTDED